MIKSMGVCVLIDKMFNNTKAIEKALDGTWLRNETIAQNISNVDTPGYKRKTVSFEEELNAAIDKSGFKGFRTDKRHIPIGGGSIGDVDLKVTEDNNSLSMRLDGNNVDVEKEMADMTKNTIQYNVLTQGLNAEFRKIRSAISEGRR